MSEGSKVKNSNHSMVWVCVSESDGLGGLVGDWILASMRGGRLGCPQLRVGVVEVVHPGSDIGLSRADSMQRLVSPMPGH